MLRLFTALAAGLVLGTGFAYLADSPAQLILSLPSWRLSLNPAAAAAGFLAAVLALMLILAFIRFLLAPLGWRSAWRRYKKAAAYKNLTEALLAAFSGDSAAAKQKQALSAQALPPRKEPLSALAAALIRAQDTAEAAFFAAKAAESGTQAETAESGAETASSRAAAQAEAEKLWLPLLRGQNAAKPAENTAQNGELRLLALKMLYEQARGAKNEAAAASYAAEAARLSPACLWASLAALDAAMRRQDWAAAQDFYENFARARGKQSKLDTTGAVKACLARGRQALLCARASALFALQPRQARDMALAAHKIDESFSPAAMLAAEILFQLDETRKAEKLALAALARAPQADLALAYIRGGGTIKSAAKQWARAQKLAALHPKAAEIQAQAAKIAYKISDYQAARRFAEHAAEQAPTRQIYALLAELAAKRGESAAACRLLAQALAAAPEKAWCADGAVLPSWQALSPKSGRLGGCQWQTPPHSAATEAELKPLRAALAALPHNAETAAKQPPASGGKAAAAAAPRKAEQTQNAPLHGFAPPDTETEGKPPAAAANPARRNVDNPGIKQPAAAKTK